jgi:magnesium-protoporphyrin IX monomethyl ester (oxidative) cyclase
MKEVGIEARASFMLALPGETPEMALETIKFAIELDPDYAQFCITTPYPGTKLYKDAPLYGRLYQNYSKYSLWSPVFVPHGYKDENEVARIENLAMRKFYFRPRYIYNRLKKIRSVEDVLRYAKGLQMAIGMSKE